MTNLENLVGREVPDDTEAQVAYALRTRCGELGAELADRLAAQYAPQQGGVPQAQHQAVVGQLRDAEAVLESTRAEATRLLERVSQLESQLQQQAQLLKPQGE